ncbi:MAG: ribonuclease E/G, partial [Gammaproteobacteria bacterium]|nr:ribonuclease E/G [Gammaproteobacteria bacterium]
IDMTPARNQREVENRLKDALKMDRARVQIGRISRFGLLEMSRQRLRSSLGESSQIVCPRCNGQGTIRSLESLALSILRILEEEAMKEKTGRVLAQVPVDVATYLLNEKRTAIRDVEARHEVHVIVVPNPHLETPHYDVQRVREDETEHGVYSQPSYQLTDRPEETPAFVTAPPKVHLEEPAVKAVIPPAPVPVPVEAEPAPRPGFIRRLWSAVFGGQAEPESEPSPERAPGRNRGRREESRRGRPEGMGPRGGGGRRGPRQRPPRGPESPREAAPQREPASAREPAPTSEPVPARELPPRREPAPRPTPVVEAATGMPPDRPTAVEAPPESEGAAASTESREPGELRGGPDGRPPRSHRGGRRGRGRRRGEGGGSAGVSDAPAPPAGEAGPETSGGPAEPPAGVRRENPGAPFRTPEHPAAERAEPPAAAAPIPERMLPVERPATTERAASSTAPASTERPPGGAAGEP